MIKVYKQTSFSLFMSLNYIKPVVQEYMHSKLQDLQLPLKRIINEAKDLLFADQFVQTLRGCCLGDQYLRYTFQAGQGTI